MGFVDVTALVMGGRDTNNNESGMRYHVYVSGLTRRLIGADRAEISRRIIHRRVAKIAVNAGRCFASILTVIKHILKLSNLSL
jgi:hypothetical protein